MKDEIKEKTDKGICPECGAKLIYQGGCKFCNCGYEVCG